MLLLVIRTAILYAVTMVSMRAMGKRQIGQLQPFELVVILIISEMATIGVQWHAAFKQPAADHHHYRAANCHRPN